MWKCPKCGRTFKNTNQDHYCGEAPKTIEEYIERQPEQAQPFLWLVIRDFRQKRNKKGMEYGMAVSVYMTPEELWGYDLVTSAYKETPEASRERIYRHVQEHYPDATEKQIRTLMK